MKTILPVLAALALAAGPALADTRTSDQDKTTQEQRAKPSHPNKQDEETTEAHSQPETPMARSRARKGTGCSEQAKARKSREAKDTKAGASAGSSAPTHLVELGAGDGTLMARLAQQRALRWPGLKLSLLDRQPVRRPLGDTDLILARRPQTRARRDGQGVPQPPLITACGTSRRP